MAEALYIDFPTGTLFGAYHRPSDDAPAGRPSVLFCSPWGCNETLSYHSRRRWATELAAAGHPVLRFDLPAVGDSSGAPGEPDLVPRWVAAVGAAAEWLQATAPGRELVAFGMELGGLLAFEAARGDAPIDALALWAMPKNGRGFTRTVQALSRMQRWGGGPDGESPLPEGWIEAAGFVISAETSEALRRLQPTAVEPPAGVSRILVLGADAIEPEAALVEHLASAGATVEAAAGPGWEHMVLNSGYAMPDPVTRKRLATWLAEGTRGDAPAVVEAPRETEFESGAWGEAIVDDLPPESFAVLTRPVEDAVDESEDLVVFLNAGAVRHIGPDRLWVDSARELAGQGVRSVRVDLSGIGEADGPSDRFEEIPEFYDPVFGDQVIAILDSLEEAGIGRRFVILGLCSGGYWSFRVSLRDDRIAKAILLNPGAMRWRDSLAMEQYGKGLSMLTEGRLWKELLRGELSVRKIRAFLGLATRLATGVVRDAVRWLRGGSDVGLSTQRLPEIEEDLDALRDAAVPAVLAFSRDEPIDRELCGGGIFDELDRWPNLTAVELPGVDHAFASTSAQAAVRELIHAQAVGDAIVAAHAVVAPQSP